MFLRLQAEHTNEIFRKRRPVGIDIPVPSPQLGNTLGFLEGLLVSLQRLLNLLALGDILYLSNEMKGPSFCISDE